MCSGRMIIRPYWWNAAISATPPKRDVARHPPTGNAWPTQSPTGFSSSALMSPGSTCPRARPRSRRGGELLVLGSGFLVLEMLLGPFDPWGPLTGRRVLKERRKEEPADHEHAEGEVADHAGGGAKDTAPG